MKRIVFVVIIFLFATILKLDAQFVESGAFPNSIKWNQIKSRDKRIVFPQYFEQKAKIIDGIMDTTKTYITTGLYPMLNYMPVLAIPTKTQSNGMVTWAPKRMELYTTPDADTYSLSWLKQLTIHEYRHVAQISNLNRGFTKAFYPLLGENAVGIVTAVVPGWFFEGDAVLAETQLSLWGRGKQPEHSIAYRAIVNEHNTKHNLKYEGWKGGSYKYQFPTAYEYGYYAAWYGETFYSPNIWGEMLSYCGRLPFIAAFSCFNLKKNYGKSGRNIVKESKKIMTDFWEKESAVDNTSRFIDNRYKWYAKYEMPVSVGGNILSSFYSMSDTRHLVTTDINSGKERKLLSTATLSSRHIVCDSIIYWTEYKPSLFWEQQSFSVIKKALLRNNRLHNLETIHLEEDNNYYITKTDNGFAVISYDKENTPSILITDDNFNIINNYPIDDYYSSINGMDWDDTTKRLYYILINNDGISLHWLDPLSMENGFVKKPSLVTIKSLRAKNGKLYYTSTMSGKDEAHTFDLLKNKEYKISNSKYGSFSPYPIDGKDDVILTTYGIKGYRLALQRSDTTDSIKWSYYPSDKLTPKWREWNVPKIDTINIDPNNKNISSKKSKKYNKASHLFNLFGWAPIAANMDEIKEENDFNIGIGATAFSQNLLGSMVSSVSGGYTFQHKLPIVTASLRYQGLPVHFAVRFRHGGDYRNIYIGNSDVSYNKIDYKNDKYTGVTLGMTLPINFSSGKRSRYLQIGVKHEYNNSIILDKHLSNDFNKTGFEINWSNYKYMAPRDIVSPLGYTIIGSVSKNLFRSDFGTLYWLYGKLNVPGVAKNQALVLRSAVQYQKEGYFNFSQKVIYPRGCFWYGGVKNLYAATAAYYLPFAYPDGGIPEVLYIKQLSLVPSIEYAHAKFIGGSGRYFYHNPYTYGLELLLDYTLLGSSYNFKTGISVYKPSDRDSFMVGVSFDFGF